MQDKVLEEAWSIWAAMTEDERFGVQFGLFPACRMPPPGEHSRKVALALMGIEKEVRNAHAHG